MTIDEMEALQEGDLFLLEGYGDPVLFQVVRDGQAAQVNAVFIEGLRWFGEDNTDNPEAAAFTVTVVGHFDRTPWPTVWPEEPTV